MSSWDWIRHALRGPAGFARVGQGLCRPACSRIVARRIAPCCRDSDVPQQNAPHGRMRAAHFFLGLPLCFACESADAIGPRSTLGVFGFLRSRPACEATRFDVPLRAMAFPPGCERENYDRRPPRLSNPPVDIRHAPRWLHTVSDLVGRLDTLTVACSKCGRRGRYRVAGPRGARARRHADQMAGGSRWRKNGLADREGRVRQPAMPLSRRPVDPVPGRRRRRHARGATISGAPRVPSG